ncbi:MAG: ABC transporter permease [Bacteroidota bacterium]
MNETHHVPPRLAQRLLHSFLRADLAEEVEGDLEEKFRATLLVKTPLRAKLNYWYQVINYLRPFAFRKRNALSPNNWDMFQNYFKIASRNLLKQKLYASINIGGLTLGLACFLVILLYVQHEFSYDRFYPNADRLYRVYQRQEGNQFMGTDYFAVTPAKLASVMMEECPEVETATAVQGTSGLLTHEDNHFWQKGIAADANYFRVFGTDFKSGNPATALQDAHSIILTASLANTIFGGNDPIGKTIRYQNGTEDYTVTAVIADPPSNASIKYSFVINLLYSQGYAEEIKKAGWNNNSYYTFLVLNEHAQVASLNEKFKVLLKKYQLPEDYKDYPFKDTYFAQPLTEAYFQTDVNFDLGQKGNRRVVYAYSAVAIIVLLLACVNYMNLAIARSVKRAREVGMRKVVGALRRQLIGQFLGESIFIALFSFVLALGLTVFVLPYFGRVVDRPVEFNLLENTIILPSLFALVLLVGLVSGSYPAFSMSSLRPVDVLKSKMKVNLGGFGLQRFLIVFQFSASIVFIISSIVIYRQLHFMKTKELGYNKEDVVTIQIKDRPLVNRFNSLATEWLQHANVKSVALSTHLPLDISSSTMINRGSDEKENVAIYQCSVEYGYFDVFGIELLAGRNFSRDVPSDATESFILNETAARMLGWSPHDAIGKQIDRDGQKNIIGVVKDFHMLSMHLPIQPLMFRFADGYGRYMSLKINHKDVPATLAHIESVFKKNSQYPFEYQFLTDVYANLYQSEEKLGEVFGFFTVVSILIASMGLFGLAAFLAQQRTKEIGIRKVLGGSVQSILFLLSRDFMGLVVVAFVVAVPLGWFAMNQWLRDFAYRDELAWWTFAVAGLLAGVIAYISIGYQSLKASRANPVESLRSE